jgi:hypothetical protein
MFFPAGCAELRNRTIILFSAVLFLTLLPGIQHGLWKPDEPQRGRDIIRFVMVVCLSLSAATTLYYNVKKEKRDYLGFTREALNQAMGSEIIILMPDEIFEGTLLMITGRTHRVLGTHADISEDGLYLWADKHDQGIQEAKKMGKVNIVLEKKIGERYARLAFIKP